MLDWAVARGQRKVGCSRRGEARRGERMFQERCVPGEVFQERSRRGSRRGRQSGRFWDEQQKSRAERLLPSVVTMMGKDNIKQTVTSRFPLSEPSLILSEG